MPVKDPKTEINALRILLEEAEARVADLKATIADLEKLDSMIYVESADEAPVVEEEPAAEEPAPVEEEVVEEPQIEAPVEEVVEKAPVEEAPKPKRTRAKKEE